jgi:hypothetical protein
MSKTRHNTKMALPGLLVMVSVMGASFMPAVQAADTVSLETYVQAQMEQAQDNILAEQRVHLKHMPLVLDNPAVRVGPIEVIETATAGSNAAPAANTSADTRRSITVNAEVTSDLVAKAVRSPGLMGVYRYIALPALEMALVAAE